MLAGIMLGGNSALRAIVAPSTPPHAIGAGHLEALPGQLEQLRLRKGPRKVLDRGPAGPRGGAAGE